MLPFSSSRFGGIGLLRILMNLTAFASAQLAVSCCLEGHSLLHGIMLKLNLRLSRKCTAVEIPVVTHGCKYLDDYVMYRYISPYASDWYVTVPSSAGRKYGCVWLFLAVNKFHVPS